MTDAKSPVKRGLWGAVTCFNSKCINYYEDCCMKNVNSESITISSSGTCEDFSEGVNSYYKEVQNDRY